MRWGAGALAAVHACERLLVTSSRMHACMHANPVKTSIVLLSACYPIPHPPGRLAGLAQQAGVQQAAAPLEDLSKGVAGLADMFGGQVNELCKRWRPAGGWGGGLGGVNGVAGMFGGKVRLGCVSRGPGTASSMHPVMHAWGHLACA